MTEAEARGPAAALVYERLLASITEGGSRRWDLASPYLLRHAPEHALEAGELAELLQDAEYLVHGAPGSVQTFGAILETRVPTETMPIYRSSLARHLHSEPEQRRQILAVDAIRHRSGRIGSRLYNPPLLPPVGWQCRWATAGNISLALKASLVGHDGPIRAIATGFVEETPIAVTAGDDGAACVWNLFVGVLHRRLRGHRRPLTSVAVGGPASSPLAITADTGGTVCCWELRTGKKRYRHAGAAAVGCLLVDAVDEKHLAISGDADGAVRLWDLVGGTPLEAVRAGGPVTRLISGGADDAPVAVAVTAAGSVVVVDLIARRAIAGFGTAASPVSAAECAFVREEPVVVTTHEDGTGHVWRLSDGALTATLTGRPGCLEVLSVIETGLETVAVTGGEDGVLRLWNLADGKLLGRMTGRHRERITAVAWHVVRAHRSPRSARPNEPDLVRLRPQTDWWRRKAEILGELAGHVVLSGSADETVQSWSASNCRPLRTFFAHTGGVADIKVTELWGEPIAVSGSEDGTASLWDLEHWRTQAEGARHPQRVDAVAVRRVGGQTVIATACGDSVLRLFTAADGKQIGHYTVGTGTVVAVGLGGTRDGAVAVTATSDGTVAARLVSTGKALWKRRMPASALEVGGSGRSATVAALHDGRITILSLRSGRVLPNAVGDGPDLPAVTAVAFGLIGRRAVLAAGTADRMAVVFDLATGSALHALGPLDSDLVHVAMTTTPGPSLLATQQADGVIKVWDAAAAEAVLTIPSSAGVASRLLFGTTAGRPVVIAAGSQNSACVWDARTGGAEAVLFVPAEVLAASAADNALVVGFGRELGLFTPVDDPGLHDESAGKPEAEPVRRKKRKRSVAESAVLVALARYGTQDIHELRRRLRKPPSTNALRGTLRKLCEQGYVERIRLDEESSPRVSYYDLLPEGSAAAERLIGHAAIRPRPGQGSKGRG
ncbi:PQQ-binding-like beta-propeller repeat protein [Amycolatopsis dendrobii]|uniref:PQQ-binding-like beta-propeller repeat protein n=1 Tax=Amycolatopsis dendrobii TaxID=2760662 RepID=A0A7W3VRE9_9PSEU|nr:PQQ-binding-like beta-propeller repeat protein [Amycolatopsis dendrobii]MBB1151735.1 PQQ-binding-like beta-propeller repeat protein [Amycolatopsis dendrobii]